ncbi:hypothetical protein CP8484711_0133A, partial [Chlamydia psittaci 84-8471/1]
MRDSPMNFFEKILVYAQCCDFP